MKTQRMILSIVFGAMLAVTGCSSDDGGTGGSAGSGGSAGTGGSAGNGGAGGMASVECTDDTGACCFICDGGVQMCVIEGFNPADGLDACATQCREQWPTEQDCGGEAAFVIECVDANGSCDALEN